MGNWLIENGKVFGEYVYIDWIIDKGVFVDIRYYPETEDLAFYLNSYEKDDTLTAIYIWPTYDGTDVYAHYISGTRSCRIKGNINMAKYTNNYPLSYTECTPGEFGSDYNLLEDTRKRISYLMETCDILLSAYNTKVTLNSLGFKNY